MLPRVRLVYILLLSFLFSVICIVIEQYGFEKFLTSSYITFDDFSPEYSAALRLAVAEDKPLQIDHYDPPPDLEEEQKIPRHIHFIWFERLYDAHLDVSDIPVAGSTTPAMCIDRNPEFKVDVWNATAARQLLEEFYPWFLPTYDGYKHPIQRVDAFKYFLLWHFGGVYMDLDISCRRALDPLLDFPAWFPKAQPFGVNNDLMASRPHHPLIGEMIAMLKPRDKNLISPYLTVFWSTGPQFTSDVLRKWYHTHARTPNEKALKRNTPDLENFYILPLAFYSETYTFFGHRPGGTWHGSDVAFVLWFADRPLVLILLALAGLSFTLMMWRRRARGTGRGTSKAVDLA